VIAPQCKDVPTRHLTRHGANGFSYEISSALGWGVKDSHAPIALCDVRYCA